MDVTDCPWSVVPPHRLARRGPQVKQCNKGTLRFMIGIDYPLFSTSFLHFFFLELGGCCGRGLDRRIRTKNGGCSRLAGHACRGLTGSSQRPCVLNDPSSVLPYSVQTPLKKSVPSCLTGFKGPLCVFSTPLLCCESMFPMPGIPARSSIRCMLLMQSQPAALRMGLADLTFCRGRTLQLDAVAGELPRLRTQLCALEHRASERFPCLQPIGAIETHLFKL